MAEAPGSRTQPPRVSRERPILKTGRTTGPRSLPDRTVRLLSNEPARVDRGPASGEYSSAFDEPNTPGARTRLRVLRSEFDARALAQKFEHRAPHRAAVEEMLDSAFVANEPEAF